MSYVSSRCCRALMGPLSDQRAMVLPLVMMGLVILGTLAVALLTIGGTEAQIAGNHFRGLQAQFLTEAGLEDAFGYFRSNPGQLVSPPTALTTLTSAQLAGPGASLSSSGTYAVQYQSAGPNTVLVVSTGTTAVGGGQRVLRATMTNAFSSNRAILVGEDLTIPGNVTVAGTCANVHANGDLTLSGSPVTIGGSATSSGDYTVSGNPTVMGESGGGRPPEPIPAINPGDFLIAAKAKVAAGVMPASELIQLKANGQVLDGNDVVITTLSPGQSYNAWTYNTGSPVKWVLSGNTGYTGTYYLEGDAEVSGGLGTLLTPWNATILATGDIEIGGSPVITGHLTDTVFVAGEDVKISGSPSQQFTGLIAAHEQVRITGNPSITGYIIAEDASTSSGTVTENSLEGSVTLTYNCGLAPPLWASLRMLSWGR